MNYYGKLIDDHPQPNKVYSFLREAMALINHEFPFRGPKELLIQNLRYENIQNGSINSFYGLEKINESNEIIYQLHYHGGLIK